MERAERIPTRQRRVSGAGLVHSALGGEPHDRVELGIYFVDASQVRLDYLHCGYFFLAYGARD